MRFAGTDLTNFMSGTNFDNIGKMAHEARAHENNAMTVGEGLITRSDIAADATVDAAKFGASATVAQGAAQGQASMFSGIASGIGSIAGGFAKKAGAGAPKTPGQPIPTNMQPLNGIPSYLSPNSSPISLENYGSVLDQW